MVDFDIQLTKRRVLASILVIGLATAAAGMGTFALFNSETTSDTNQITAGNMNLTVDSGFSAGGLYPTQTTDNQTIELAYDPGPDANLSITSVSTTGTLDWNNNLSVNQAYVKVNGNVDYTYAASTLGDLEEDNVVKLSSGDSIDFIVDLKLDGSAGNEFQGESTNIDVTFNATQDTS